VLGFEGQEGGGKLITSRTQRARGVQPIEKIFYCESTYRDWVEGLRKTLGGEKTPSEGGFLIDPPLLGKAGYTPEKKRPPSEKKGRKSSHQS